MILKWLSIGLLAVGLASSCRTGGGNAWGQGVDPARGSSNLKLEP